MPDSRYQLLVFDWDGTLMDSAARIVSSLRIAIQQAGLAMRTEQQLLHIIGLGLNEAVHTLYPEGIDPDQQRILIEVYRFQFIEANPTPSRLFEGVPEMLHSLAAKGYRLAVATGKSRAGLNRSLREQGMESLFPVSRCADESGSKPDPAMLNEILDEYKLPVSSALMVGDTEFDLEMARRAGVDAVAVVHGAHGKQQLLRAQPLIILDHISQLPAWLNSRSVSGGIHGEKTALAGNTSKGF